MNKIMKPIPVASAAKISKLYGYDQVIIIARRVGDEGGEHVTTYGRNATHCDVAARVGNFLKHKIMDWPEFPDAEHVIMPREAPPGMIEAMECIARAMLETVHKLDVSLVYGTAVQYEVSQREREALMVDKTAV